MRKLFLLLLSGTLSTACVDKDYDLENIDTDNIAIGDEDSRFEIPLAKVLVTKADISDGGNDDIQELCEKADKWLPSSLSVGDGFVDLTRLGERSYTDGLFDALIAEMKSSPAKLDLITDMIWEDYREVFAESLGVSAGDDDKELFKSAFKAKYATDARVLAEIRSQFSGYLTDDLNVEPIAYSIGHVDISSDVIDMIADNLDPRQTASPKNTLHLAGEIRSKLPLSLHLEPELTASPADGSAAEPFLRFGVDVDATRQVNEIKDSEQTRLYAESLRQLVDNASIRIPVTLERYYPGRGFDTGSTQIEINLHLIKRGALKLDL